VSGVTLCCDAALALMGCHHISYTDGFFETMSAISTTGVTVSSCLYAASPGFVMGRCLRSWLGCSGVVGMAVAILALVTEGVRRLFKPESSDWSEKVMPRSDMAGKYLIVIYLAITLLAFIAFRLAGMDNFDAINHAMSTVATGGYSASDASLGQFSNASHWVAIVFMIIGSLPFTLYVATARGNRGALWQDEQVRGFLLLLATTSLLFSAWYWLKHD